MKILNLKLAYRNLLKNKLYTILSITGFTFGFAFFILIALYIFQEKTVDKGFVNHRNIYRLIDDESKCNLNYLISTSITQNLPEVVYSCPVNLIMGIDIPLKSGDNSVRLNNLASTTNDFFEIFSLQTVTKTSEKPFADINSAVITKSLADLLFPDGEPLGKEVNLSGFNNIIISAVINDFPENTSITASLFLNIDNEKYRFSRSCHNNDCIYLANHFLLLKDETDIKQLTDKMNLNLSVPDSRITSLSLQKLDDIYFSKNIEGNKNRTGNQSLVIIYLAIAIAIVVLSVINQLNFNISLQYSRLKSIGIRMINGADGYQMSYYYMLELSIIIILSMFLAFDLARLLLSRINQLFPVMLDPHLFFSPVFLMILAAVTLIVIIINSTVPLINLSKFRPGAIISGSYTGRMKRRHTNILIIFQYFISCILIIVVLIMTKQVHYVKNSNPGFNTEDLIKIHFPQTFMQQKAFKQKIDQLAFVRNSTLSEGVFGDYNIVLDEGPEFVIKEIKVDNNFLNTLNIKLVDGRNFLQGDQENAFLFNKTAYKKYEGLDKDHNQFQGKEIIGTIEDFNVSSFHSAIEPVCLLLSDELTEMLSVRLTPGDYSQKLKMIEQIWASFIKDEPMNYNFYNSFFDGFYKKEENLIKLIGLLGLVSVIITCMGIFGQIYHDTLIKTKEIGIHKIHGAKTTEIMYMLNKNLFKLITIAFIISIPVAYWVMRTWLINFAYKTSLSWWVFGLSGIITFSIALLTVSWQSWRAATRNPVEALRYE